MICCGPICYTIYVVLVVRVFCSVVHLTLMLRSVCLHSFPHTPAHTFTHVVPPLPTLTHTTYTPRYRTDLIPAHHTTSLFHTFMVAVVPTVALFVDFTTFTILSRASHVTTRGLLFSHTRSRYVDVLVDLTFDDADITHWKFMPVPVLMTVLFVTDLLLEVDFTPRCPTTIPIVCSGGGRPLAVYCSS